MWDVVWLPKPRELDVKLLLTQAFGRGGAAPWAATEQGRFHNGCPTDFLRTTLHVCKCTQGTGKVEEVVDC
jgi:hypothetical protein